MRRLSHDSISLPREWGGEGHMDKNSPRIFLKNAYSLELPITGGWGYSVDDSVVINKNDPALPKGHSVDAPSIEHLFFEKRVYAELIVFRNANDKYSGIKWDLIEQNLEFEGDRKFDCLRFQVSAFPDEDWNYLKDEWEQNHHFENDPEGQDRHDAERLSRQCHYDTECWFDITSIF